MAKCIDCEHYSPDKFLKHRCMNNGEQIDDDVFMNDEPCRGFKPKEEKKMATTRKTKDELMTELEAKETEIKELKEDLKKLEKYKQYEDMANEMKAMHDAFMNSGFSDEQAFALVNNMVTTVTATVTKNPLAFLR